MIKHNWLDEVPSGFYVEPLIPEEVDALDNQARIWATLREAVNQAYAEGYNAALAFQLQKEFPF